ncbi:LamG-like jellyroll fold domain-containing protein [Winogradskyella sp. 4-2091]|uniref:LamG-like jellyroll fold domain-containing protein n=1 Tax=Winogradskyella sp. 4-2091 TaxID=3381659 RepID=UPI003891CE19
MKISILPIKWKYILFVCAIHLTSFSFSQDFKVQGNSISIVNGDITPNINDLTDFGSSDVGFPISHTFTIENLGNSDLNISNISLSNNTDFSIIGASYSSPISVSNTTTFTIQYNAVNSNLNPAIVTINSDDLDENPYEFTIIGQSNQNCFDSDGDGVFDNVDIDDDNDGIMDTDEELACQNSNIAISTNYKYLNETFGVGTNRTTINTTYNAATSYNFEDAAGENTDHNLNDGEYTVYYKAGNGDGVNQTPNGEVAAWADSVWYTGEDHTPGDSNGRMAMFNASYDTGLFYTASITGSLPNVPITYSFWVLNLDTSTTNNIDSRLRPDIRVEFRDISGNLLAGLTTGDIPPSINGDPENSWHNFSANLTFNVSEFNVFFYNNETGGLGNDLAIDDISIVQTLCDTDNDGIANVFDLDSDNDGIPDIVEAGYGNLSNGQALISNWVDSDGNGMHDTLEGLTILDSDNDGTPNFIDLDSDNDSIFDVDESGAGNSSNTSYQNGDGDIDGDGVGDGPDTDYVREKDYDSDGTIEFFADGILDIYDFHNGNTMSSAYGNTNQGNGNTYFVLDSDVDSIPDYIDTYNNNTNIYDISQTLYADLDANGDGVIDGSVDNDNDGIVDTFDTDDDAFGSPRNLDKKLQLYFDGRNDYIQDQNLFSGWPQISLMGWIKIDSESAGRHSYLFGQNNYSMKIRDDGRLLTVVNGKDINSLELPTDQWVHVASTYSDDANSIKVYINGELVTDLNLDEGVLDADTTPFYLGRRHNDLSPLFYQGYMDEIRLFNKALSEDEIHKIVYQEIEQNGTNIRGTEIPRDVTDFINTENINPLLWSNLVKYYRLDNFKGDVTDNLTTSTIDSGFGAKLYNIKQIEYQSAPMPFITQQSGSLSDAVNSTEDGVVGQDAITYDWSIVKVLHNDVMFDDRQKHLGLFINEKDANDNPIEYHVNNDSELNVSWYLKLDGFIDLENESQLVQGEDSLLDDNSIGKIERDQQGTADTYTYNYWSSPVKRQNSTAVNFRITDIMQDGSDADDPIDINFSSSGYNGSEGDPIKIADYWIWKYANLPTGDYSSWQHIRRTGRIYPGEGFTMKGPGTGSNSTPQNYVFSGKPNNGDINLTLAAENDYLVGNPYPSAIDANIFIRDNGPELLPNDASQSNSEPRISGTLYFWEHWGGGSHVLQDYQGGYATYNYSGAVAAAYKADNHPGLASGETPTKEPGRYIPIGQGFFITGQYAGTINFNNGQRIFSKENSTSVFLRNAFSDTSATDAEAEDGLIEDDLRMKFRIGFKSVNTIKRQLLLTIDENTTTGVDWAYDGLLNEVQIDDMFWRINDQAYIIQGSNEAEVTTTYPLGIKTNTDGVNTINIDKLENVPNEFNVYLHDIDLDIYHDLKASNYNIFLTAGEYLDRFEITFGTQEEALSIDDIAENSIDVLYSNTLDKIVIANPNLIALKSMTLFNILGQLVYTNTNIEENSYSEYNIKNLSTGTYIIKLQTETGSFVTKKVIIK